MGSLIVALLPLALGIIISPLTIVAVIVVLVSPRGRTNSVAFLVGWLVGIVLVVVVSWAVFNALDVQPREGKDTPVWVGVVHLVIGLVLLAAASWTFTRKRVHVREMAAAATPEDVVAAAPQLPGWLQQVDTFTPVRTTLLAMALMILNPVDLSCGVGAGLQLALGDVDLGPAVILVALFTLVGGSTVIVPVVLALTRGAQARPVLERLRTWIAGNTGAVNALLLAFIGILQVVKGIQLI